MQRRTHSIAIVGAGPAGSSLAYLLARAGREVLLFTPGEPPEKHCGGGVPVRSFHDFPWLDELSAPFREIVAITLISPKGVRCDLELPRPLRLYDRRAFDNRLRDLAAASGARLISERVRRVKRENARWLLHTDNADYPAGYLVGAGGAQSLVRRTVSRRFPPSTLSLCAGYYIPAPDGRRIYIGFLKRKAAYAWIFPRPGPASAGIVAPLIGCDRESLLKELREWIEREFPGRSFDYSCPYAALVSSFNRRSGEPRGRGWALAGDAAGVADPVTREGIYYSIKSAEILSGALLAGSPSDYGVRLRDFFTRRHRTGLFVRNYLFTPFFSERVVRLAKNSASAHRALERFFSGTLDYGSVLFPPGLLNSIKRVRPS